MGFRKLQGVPLPEVKQGLIYYTCINFSEQPYYIQQKIIKLCESAGGEYARALFELLTTGAEILPMAQKHYVSEETLRRKRRDFYKSW